MKITYWKEYENNTYRYDLRAEYSSMYFGRDDYQDEATLFAEIGKFIQMLCAKGMEMEIHDEGVGVVVEWNHDPSGSDDYGDDRLMWVSDEEQERIIGERRETLEGMVKNGD